MLGEMMNTAQAQTIAEILKAVAHPVRLQILSVLGQNERCVSEIMNALDAAQSAISQQLSVMRTRGVLSCRRDANRVFYRVSHPGVMKLLACMIQNPQ